MFISFHIKDIKRIREIHSTNTMKYSLDDIYEISRQSIHYTIEQEILDNIHVLNSQVVPIHVHDKVEKKENFKRKPNKPSERDSHKKESNMRDFYEMLKNQKVDEKPDGIDKWIDNLQFCLNKMSSKNYDTEKEEFMLYLDKCLTYPYDTLEEKTKVTEKINKSILNIIRSNKYYVSLYAELYKSIISKYAEFNQLLQIEISDYINSIKQIEYTDPEKDYEAYCINNKKNDIRKAITVFLIHLTKEKVLPVLRVMNIIVSFQTLIIEYIEEADRVDEVDEISEILYLFLKEGKSVFDECKDEWTWKFAIKQNIDTLSKYTKKDKPSLSSRSVFKFMDIAKVIE
jgi:hypothetical protein